MSRFCEEFGCLPSALAGEDPAELLAILDYRAYARAKHALDTYEGDEKHQPTGGAVDDVWAVMHELKQRRSE